MSNDWYDINVQLFVDQWQAFGAHRMAWERSGPEPPVEQIRVIVQKSTEQAIFDRKATQARLVLRYLTAEAPTIDNGHTLKLDDGRRCRVDELSRDTAETELHVRVVA